MPSSEQLEAIILKTYDVGEADRFCILFTRERGRLAVRARGVRKPKSRMGAMLLALRPVSLEVKPFGEIFLVSSAVRLSSLGDDVASHTAFSIASQAAELLLALLQNDAPIPRLFDVLKELLESCSVPRSPHLSVAFTVRVLHILGLLPEAGNTSIFHDLSAEERVLVDASIRGVPLCELRISSPRRLEQHCSVILGTQLRIS